MPESAKPLHIDIPVKLAEVKVIFSVGALAFEGDLPASLFHIQVLKDDIADWNAKSEVIAVFHTNAGHGMGSQWMLTGYQPTIEVSDNIFPSCGSVVAKMRGPNEPGLPAYVTLKGARVPKRLKAGFKV